MLRLIFFFAALGSLFVCESLVHTRPWEIPRVKRWIFHMAVSIFNTVWTRLTVAVAVLAWLRVVENHGWGISRMLGLAGVVEIVGTIIVFDFFDYWWHRFNHLVPFLWRFHKVHHTDTHVDVTTTLRFHPGELFFSYGAKVCWIFIWGPSLAAFAIFETGITLYALFHHSNIDFPDRWEKRLRLVHMTPRLHAGHHTVSLRTRDGNYSTIFLIWDRLFGTLREPDFEELKTLGLSEGRATYLEPGVFLAAPFRGNADETRRVK